MRTIIADKDTAIFDSLTNKKVEVVKAGDEIGIEADAPLKRKVGAIVRNVTEVYRREVNKRGENVNRFFWFVPSQKAKPTTENDPE